MRIKKETLAISESVRKFSRQFPVFMNELCELKMMKIVLGIKITVC